ncbi:unnamed protein product [Urochloa decumbens]|uniref:peptide-methionine (S)-S-oxide reductase n=1 Tax=Urochloa decumbens TaxID=240449 RepID=A0ABC9F4V2_9POAL
MSSSAAATTAASPALEPNTDLTRPPARAMELTYQRLPGVACPYATLLDVFWAKIDPTALNRQGEGVGTQYRTGIYYYTAEQERLARESLAEEQKKWEDEIVTEILPAKRFYPAEEYHQRHLEKGGQSAEKGCTDPMRCYG